MGDGLLIQEGSSVKATGRIAQILVSEAYSIVPVSYFKKGAKQISFSGSAKMVTLMAGKESKTRNHGKQFQLAVWFQSTRKPHYCSEKGVIDLNKSPDISPPRSKRNKFPAMRVAGARVYDPVHGKTCHQCRQKTMDFVVACTNLKKNKTCTAMYCYKCLFNRYGEKAEELVALGNWCCHKCMDDCNCSLCMKRRGLSPTGVLTRTAKASGVSSGIERLTEHLNGENVCAPSEKGKEKIDNTSSEDIKTKKRKLEDHDTPGITGIDHNRSVLDFQKSDLYSDFPLPVGIEMRNVCGIDVPAQNVGSALQFLEFCAAFGEILEVNEQPELILQDLLHSKPGESGELSLTARFHIHLLSKLQEEEGEEDSRESPSHQEQAWFITLKECLSLSPSVLTQNGLDCLETMDNYEALDASQKLLVLNILCDELLETEKLRIWINDQNIIHAEKVREARKEVAAARDEEKNLRKKMKNDIAQAVTSSHSGDIPVSEHEAIVSRFKADMAVAHAKVLESKGIVLKHGQTSDAVRTEPFFMGDRGHAFWKLNCLGKSNVLRQDIGQGDSLTLNETWYAIDEDGKEAVEKHISASKRKKVGAKRRRGQE